MARDLRSAIRYGAVGACAAAVFVTGFPLDASADPDAVQEAKERVEELEMEAAALDQEAVGAQEKLDEAKERLSTQKEDVAEQAEKVKEMKRQVGKVAVTQYQGRHIDPTTQVFLDSQDDEFLSRYATVQQVNSNQNDVLQTYQIEQANLNDMRRSAETDVKTIDEQTQKVKEARDASQEKLDEAQKELDRLTEEERQRLEEIERKEREEAERAAQEAAEQEEDSADESPDGGTGSDRGSDAGSSGNGGSGSSSSDGGSGVDVPPGSSKGQAALAFAKAQIGKPYIFGGTGPSGYDCSGLTGAAWSSVGVSIPRTSQAQFGAGSSVSKGDLQPGDLVFYYGGISHVGIYAGGGQIVHASRPGKPIGYAPLDSMPYAGARRVG
ncbi:NlpC/P60 family protein [Propioniferax innocua]|uniref:NlpC/P60 family protein n=1 Tax=Propioniferax innocua TaxID=1753 RepID=A0A542ZRB8_9ACTN|nr:C40 family peptidase [Propioniferax innocua]TQL62836.1 NlpC/P60 family protein [Propioniferax innocua]